VLADDRGIGVKARLAIRFGNLRKSQRIRMRLGGIPDPFAPFPAKPRRMHQRTYLRLRAQAGEAEAITFGRR
jgi:hypothetical protein